MSISVNVVDINITALRKPVLRGQHAIWRSVIQHGCSDIHCPRLFHPWLIIVSELWEDVVTLTRRATHYDCDSSSGACTLTRKRVVSKLWICIPRLPEPVQCIESNSARDIQQEHANTCRMIHVSYHSLHLNGARSLHAAHLQIFDQAS